MKETLAARTRRLLEGEDLAPDGPGPSEVADTFAALERAGCLQWVKKQIDVFVRSHFTNALAKDRLKMEGFLHGSVYGWVVGKTGDVGLAETAGRVALHLALHDNREVT